MGELADCAEETFTQEYSMMSMSVLVFNIDFAINREQHEHRVFRLLLHMVPGMEDCLMEGSEEDTLHIAELVCNYSGPSHMHF